MKFEYRNLQKKPNLEIKTNIAMTNFESENCKWLLMNFVL